MNYRYLRAYMAGIVAPTAFLLVVLTAFCLARFVFHVPVPIERVIVFPMALIPNLFGAWNMLWVGWTSSRRLSVGLHGALLPFVLVPVGFALASLLGIVTVEGGSVVAFETERLAFGYVAMAFPVVVAGYYLVWKYIVGFLNAVVGVE
jgi:hypothetical protein